MCHTYCNLSPSDARVTSRCCLFVGHCRQCSLILGLSSYVLAAVFLQNSFPKCDAGPVAMHLFVGVSCFTFQKGCGCGGGAHCTVRVILVTAEEGWAMHSCTLSHPSPSTTLLSRSLLRPKEGLSLSFAWALITAPLQLY